MFAVLTLSVGALGGILVALVVKHTNSIIKGFASSLAIVVITFMSHFLFGAPLTLNFALGTVTVIVSVFNYSEPDPKPADGK